MSNSFETVGHIEPVPVTITRKPEIVDDLGEYTMPQPPLPLFIAVTKGCDMQCWYCTEYGESRSGDGARMSDTDILTIAGAAYEAGVRTFRFTGGEPTLRSSLGQLMLATDQLGDDVRIAMTTNGSRLEEVFPYLLQMKRPSVFLSIDTVDDLREDTAENGTLLEKWISPKIKQIIADRPDNVDMRLNHVLTSATAKELPKLIEFATENGIDLKIFELLLRDYYYVEGQTTKDAFLEQYRSVRSLLESFYNQYGEPEVYAGTGGRGIPMYAFKAESGTKIVFFDSSGGSHYGDACDSCSHFPCQEGLYGMTLASNGTLHPAGCVNETLYIDMLPLSHTDRVRAIKKLGATIGSATLRPDVPDIFAILGE